MAKLVIANWKMNPHSPRAGVRLARAIDSVTPHRNLEVIIAPPFPYLPLVGRILRHAKLGAQDLFWEEQGARTGEVSGHQLKHLGVKYVIVGHSERRELGETDLVIRRKLKAAINDGLRVVLCIGEPWSARKRGVAAAKKFLKKQLKEDLKGIKGPKFKTANLIVAYEPVWAIGTGKSDSPADAVEMSDFIKKTLRTKKIRRKIKLLYGGSINSKNVTDFIKQPSIDGVLVGGASTQPKEIKKILSKINF